MGICGLPEPWKAFNPSKTEVFLFVTHLLMRCFIKNIASENGEIKLYMTDLHVSSPETSYQYRLIDYELSN